LADKELTADEEEELRSHLTPVVNAWLRAAQRLPSELTPTLTRAASRQTATSEAALNGGTASRIGQQEQAIALLLNDPSLTDSAIAERVGVHRSTLYRWKKYKQTRAAFKQIGKSAMARGQKDKSGRVEAWDDNE